MLTKFISSKRLSFLFTFLFISAQLYSQIYQPNRFEIEIEDKDYEVVSAKEDGLFLIKSYRDLENAGTVWEVIRLDSTLKFQWERSYIVPYGQYLSGKYYDRKSGLLFFLFSRNEVKNRNLELISFKSSDGTASSTVINNFIPISFFDFKANNSSVIIAGYYNAMPLVMLYNIVEGVPIVLPGLFGDRKKLLQLLINDDQSFDITVSGQDLNKKGSIFVNTYNYSGILLNNIKVSSDDKRDLLFGMTTKLDNEDRLVAGTYGKNFSDFSKGLFLANIDNKDGNQIIKYYGYGELKNFFNYMNERRETRVRNRIERRKIKDKKLRFSYRLMVHNLIKSNDQLILFGEAFYPKYKIVGSNYRGNGRIVETFNNGFITTNRVFEGYQYTHAVIIGFGKNGELLWDNSFEINDVLSFNLKKLVHVSVSDEIIALLYVYENSIRSKLISENNVLNDKELTPIKLTYESDRVDELSTKIIGFEAWYANTFYTYGTQKIKNLTNSGVELNREVFFINKVIYK